MSYVTKAYDFFDAITANKNLTSPQWAGFALTQVVIVTDSQSIVETTHGKFLCESFEDANGEVYMRVSAFF